MLIAMQSMHVAVGSPIKKSPTLSGHNMSGSPISKPKPKQ